MRIHLYAMSRVTIEKMMSRNRVFTICDIDHPNGSLAVALIDDSYPLVLILPQSGSSRSLLVFITYSNIIHRLNFASTYCTAAKTTRKAAGN